MFFFAELNIILFYYQSLAAYCIEIKDPLFFKWFNKLIPTRLKTLLPGLCEVGWRWGRTNVKIGRNSKLVGRTPGENFVHLRMPFFRRRNLSSVEDGKVETEDSGKEWLYYNNPLPPRAFQKVVLYNKN